MSDGPQGPGWWLASDGKWYPPQPVADQPTAPQAPVAGDPGTPAPGGYDPNATTAVTPPTAAGPAYGQPGAPGFPPPGAPTGPPTAPAWGSGPGAPGGPPTDTASGGGGGGKVALAIGVIVLVLLVLGGIVFAVTRPKDVVVEGPGTTQTATTQKAATTEKPSTTKKSTTTTEGDSSTTSSRSSTTTSKTSTSSTLDPNDPTTKRAFDIATEKMLPNTSAADREQLAQELCDEFPKEETITFLQNLKDKVPAGTTATQYYAFVGASFAAFCPENLDKLEKLGNGG